MKLSSGKNMNEEMIVISKPYFDEEDYQAVSSAMRSTFVSGDGPECRAFEAELAQYLGVKHAFFLNSATAGLDIAFKIKNFKVGSEVLVPNFTFTSSALGPMLNGLKVVLVDVDSRNGNIDIADMESKITKNTVAIVPVDYGGVPADMESINSIAKRKGLYVVHDSAQSIGASINGKKTGTMSDVGIFSFHGTKNLVVGEGGAITTNDDELAKRILIVRDKGTDKHQFITDNKLKGYYSYEVIGNSYVQSNILGALGRTQLKKLDWMNAKRKKIAHSYLEAFKDFKIDTPFIPAGCESNWHLFYILLPPKMRDTFIGYMKENNIVANIHYHPLHKNKLYIQECDVEDDHYSGSNKFYESLVRLPLYPSLNDEEVMRIINATSISLKKLELY